MQISWISYILPLRPLQCPFTRLSFLFSLSNFPTGRGRGGSGDETTLYPCAQWKHLGTGLKHFACSAFVDYPGYPDYARSNCDGDVTILEHVFINLNFCCIQWYKFHVCRGKGSRDTVTQITCVHQNHKNGLFHGLTAPHLMGMSQYFYIPL